MANSKISFIVIFLLCIIKVNAQNDDCELTISRALSEFNAGHFYIIPSVLDPCLDQFTKEQSQRAYLLLTQAYLLLDDPIGAKQSYLKVLKANPEFVTDTTLHSIDVIYLSKKFTATSIFSCFAKAGPNISIPRVISELNAFGDPAVKEKYNLKIGYQASVGGDLNVSDKMSIRGEISYMMTSYIQQSNDYFKLDEKKFTDKQSWVSVPLSILYSDAVGKYRPYGYAGYSFQYLIADRANIAITNNKPASASGETLASDNREKSRQESPTLDLFNKRTKFNQSILVGGGLKIKTGLDYVFIDVRYSIGLKNIINTKGAYGEYDNNTLDQTSDTYIKSLDTSLMYAHVDNYFRMDNLFISVGFLRPLYKPRELRRARTKSVMKQIKNAER
jgi:hypothetical protein